MKKITALLMSLLLILCMGTTAFAQDVTISTTVPERHSVSIEVDGRGKVVANHQICGESIQVARQSQQAYWMIPDAGKVLSALYYNGKNVTAQVKVGVFTAPALTDDATLRAVFTDAKAPSEDTGYDVGGTVTDPDGKPVPGATVDIGGQTGVTDENGNFTIEDVPIGKWTVTVTDEEGNVTGIGEITITEPGSGSLTVTTDENGNPVITPGSGTTSIGMTVTIGEDGIIAISDIKDTTVPSSGPVGSGGGDTDTGTDTGAGTDTGRPGITESGSAQTGDSAQPAAWIVCMITSIAFACLTVMGIQRKRKENENIGK